jgi:hypothetical protein
MSDFATEQGTSISIESVLIKSPLNPVQLDISRITTDLDIFEHIDKPYVSAVLSFIDGDEVMSSLNISGAETVTLKLKANTKVAVTIEKEFYIDRVVMTKKGNETNEMVILHLTEKHNYESNLQNVNKAYSGKPTTIMSKLAKLIGQTLNVTKEVNQDMKLIVPNLTPLNAMAWIKNKLSTEKGYPYYMYSCLSEQGIYLVDLKTVLSTPAMNAGAPYTYTESAIPSTEPSYNDTSRRRVILDYQVKNTENLFELIDKGLVGAKHTYVDVTQNKTHVTKDSMSTVINTLVGDKLLQNNPLYSPKYGFDKLESRSITQIMATKSFDDTNAYSESSDTGQYKWNVEQQVMDGLIKKQPLDIIVNGIDFLQTEENSTIGNKIEVKFPANLNDEGKRKDRFDEKKSGEYLIYAAKHSIRFEDYRIALTCVKLSNGEV